MIIKTQTDLAYEWNLSVFLFGNSTAVNNHASSLLRSLCLSFSLSLPPVRSVVPITISIILDLEFPNLVKKYSVVFSFHAD